MPTPLRVLILEDRRSDVELVLHELRRAGFEPDWQHADNEADYLSRLDSGPDIILADYFLPGFDGLRALELLQQRGLDIPLIIVSGLIGEDMAVEAIQKGAADYVLKDRLPRLRAAVAQALEQKRLRDEERRLAEEAERLNEFNHNILQTMAEGLSLEDLEGRITFVNPKLQGLLGYRAEELLGQPWTKIVPTDEIPRLTAESRRHAKGVSSQYETRLLTYDGREISVMVSATPFTRHGEFAGTLAVFTDLTERLRAEAALQKSEERFRSLIEHGSDLITILDKHGIILYESPASKSLLGYEPDELIGHGVFEFVHLSDLRRMREKFSHLTDAPGQMAVIEARFRQKDGSWKYLEALGRNLLHNPAVGGIVVHSRDVTERKQREQEQQAIAIVSSALRTAMTRAEMLPIILEQMLKMLQADGAALALRDPATGETVIELGHGDWARFTDQRLPPGTGFIGKVIASGKAYLTNTAHGDPLLFRWGAERSLHAVACVPLIAREQTLGALTIARENDIVAFELRLLTAMADMAANAIYRMTLYERTEQHVEQLAAVNNLGRVLSETLDLPQIYEQLHDATLRMLPDATTIFISLFDAERKLIRCVFGIQDGERVEVDDLPPIPLTEPGTGVHSDVIHTRRPLILNNLPNWLAPSKVKALVETPVQVTQSALYVPMIAKGQVIGLIHVQSEARQRYGQADAELLSVVGNTAAVAIENARLFAETRRRLERLQATHTVDAAITASLDLRVTLNVLLDQVTTHLNVEAAAVLLLNPHTQMLDYTAGRGFRTRGIEHFHLHLGEGYTGLVALERRTLTIPNIAKTEIQSARRSLFKEEGFVAYFGTPLVVKGQVKGVLEVFRHVEFSPDLEWIDFLETLAGQAAIAIDNTSLFESLQRSNVDLTLAYDAAIEGWSHALDLRDEETEGHSQRVTEMTLRLARAIGLNEAELVHVRRGALLHDIGKMGVPDSILLKPAALTEDEWVIMRKHPVYAYELLAPIAFLGPALDIPYCHHERWDGQGYPRGLKAEQIPLSARIFTVADVWDALCSDRPYRKGWQPDTVRDYIRKRGGADFDPKVVEAFLKLEL
jgi:PAS domain S-box-containing protein/putative nucleotidyltransferase with HDIG domain